MFVKSCMTRNVEIVEPACSLREAAEKMRDGDFGILPIAENDRLIGMITDRDIVVRAVAEGKDPRQVTVRDIMSKEVLYCFEDQTLEEVAQNLGENQIRRLPVLSREKRLVGILSLGDLSQSKADPFQVEEALTHISNSKRSSYHSEARS
jgi:CBS domain-containing protein